MHTSLSNKNYDFKYYNNHTKMSDDAHNIKVKEIIDSDRKQRTEVK